MRDLTTDAPYCKNAVRLAALLQEQESATLSDEGGEIMFGNDTVRDLRNFANAATCITALYEDGSVTWLQAGEMLQELADITWCGMQRDNEE